MFQYIGELCRYLVNSPPHPKETAHQLRLACGNGLRPDVWPEFQKRLQDPAHRRVLRRDRRQRLAVQLRGQGGRGRPRSPGSSPAASRPRWCSSTSRRSSRCATRTASASNARDDEPGEVIGKIISDAAKPGARFEGYATKAETDKKILHDVFEKGDVWFRTGDLMRKDARRLLLFRRPHRRHLPLEGRERLHHRGRGSDRPVPRHPGGQRLRRACARARWPRRHGRDRRRR